MTTIGPKLRSNIQEARASLKETLAKKKLGDIENALKDYKNALKTNGVKYDPSGLIDMAKAEIAKLEKNDGILCVYLFF